MTYSRFDIGANPEYPLTRSTTFSRETYEAQASFNRLVNSYAETILLAPRKKINISWLAWEILYLGHPLFWRLNEAPRLYHVAVMAEGAD